MHALRGDFDPPKQADVGMLSGRAQAETAHILIHPVHSNSAAHIWHTFVQNSERACNLLIGALKQFPMEYVFNLVYKLDAVSIEHSLLLAF